MEKMQIITKGLEKNENVPKKPITKKIAIEINLLFNTFSIKIILYKYELNFVKIQFQNNPE